MSNQHDVENFYKDTPTPDREDELREKCREYLLGRLTQTRESKMIEDLLAQLDEQRAVIERLPKDRNGKTILPFDRLILEREGYPPLEITALCGYEKALTKDFPAVGFSGYHESVMVKADDESALAASGGSDE